MRIVVTGGAGFIGSHLVERLVKDGHVVYVIDELSTGSIKNIKHLFDKIVFYNTRAYQFFSVRIPRIDIIVHLGIPSSSPMYRENRHLVTEAIKDFIYILEYAKTMRANIILASTSSLYNGNKLPWNESMDIFPTDFYTEARYYMERLAYLYYDFYGVRTIVLRFFSVYGEREEYKGCYANVLTQMIWSIIRDKPFTIYHDGNQKRDFIYVGDVVKCIVKAIEKIDEREINYGIFNVCTGESYSFNHVKDIIEQVTGKRLKTKYIQVPLKNYIWETRGDPTRASRYLGFKAKTKIRDGITRVYHYYNQVLKNE